MSISIVPKYERDDSQAKCPTCGHLVKCESVIVNLAFHPRYVQFIHHECGTEWKHFIDTGETIELLKAGGGDE